MHDNSTETGLEATDAPGGPTPLLRNKSWDEPSVFSAANLLREARRQRQLGTRPVPGVCLLDPDGDVVRHLKATGDAVRHEDWACYHTELWATEVQGRQIGIVACAVGAPYAVLVAEQLAVSGCELLISVTSAGSITPLGTPPYFILIDKAWRDEGTSLHYLPPGDWAHLDPGLAAALDGAFDHLEEPVHQGASWTTDACGCRKLGRGWSGGMLDLVVSRELTVVQVRGEGDEAGLPEAIGHRLDAGVEAPPLLHGDDKAGELNSNASSSTTSTTTTPTAPTAASTNSHQPRTDRQTRPTGRVESTRCNGLIHEHQHAA